MERRITIDKLWFEFGNDKYYGEEFPGAGEARSLHALDGILESVGFNKTGFRLEAWCRNCVQGNNYPPLTLALVLCGLDELDTFLPGEKEPTGWKYESFSKNFRNDLEINLNDLKSLMRRRELPLPVSLFPTEPDNTEEVMRLGEKEYSEAFEEFAAIADVEREKAEWEVMNPTSITEKDIKERKLSDLEASLQKMKEPAVSPCQTQYPELSSHDLMRLAELNACLELGPYDTNPLSELDQRLGKLIEDGYEPEKANKILQILIKKSELLLDIKKREDTPCKTHIEIDSREAAIKNYNDEIDRLNKKMNGTNFKGNSSLSSERIQLNNYMRPIFKAAAASEAWKHKGSRSGFITYFIEKHKKEIDNIIGIKSVETISRYLSNEGMPAPWKKKLK